MVLGQADGPLLRRHLDVADADTAVAINGLLAALKAEHERTDIRRVGQEVVHRAIARASPPDPALPDRAARELHAPDRIRDADRPPRQATKTFDETCFIRDAVGLAEHLPGAPHRELRVAGEHAEPSDAVDRRLQAEEEGLARGERCEAAAARPPEVDLADPAGHEELPPASVGMPDVPPQGMAPPLRMPAAYAERESPRTRYSRSDTVGGDLRTPSPEALPRR
jgi:hypothetical protein